MVVVHDVAQVVTAAVVGLAHAHGVVREVDIAVVAEDCLEKSHIGQYFPCWSECETQNEREGWMIWVEMLTLRHLEEM